jgi:hypothetical protein
LPENDLRIVRRLGMQVRRPVYITNPARGARGVGRAARRSTKLSQSG